MGLKNPKLKYPKSVAFIVSNEFCERFCFYGLRAILVLYFTRKLGYDDDRATITFHVFTSLAFFFPIMGAIIADSWLGRFRTILYLSFVYMIGNMIIALGAIPPVGLPSNEFTLLGLLLIAIGTGGIKPCVTAFGGDQFKLPEQAKQLAFFFSLFYMAINGGSLLSTVITPILREDVHCFGEDSCFSLAFGVPGILMIISIFIFLFGKPFYVITKPSGNMLVLVSKCIWNAVWTRRSERRSGLRPRSHWLDYSVAKFGPRLVDDVKMLLKILLLYVPIPLFWALQDQQGSRWTFQATRMNGELGPITIKPDQMQMANPLMIVMFIPLWNWLVYPAIAQLGIKRPLQKLVLGMMCTGCAFLASGLLELRLEALDPPLPGPRECQLRIFNGLNEPFSYRVPFAEPLAVDSMTFVLEQHIEIEQFRALDITVQTVDERVWPATFQLTAGTAVSYFVTTTSSNGTQFVEFAEAPGKPHQGQPLIRVLATNIDEKQVILKRTSGDLVKKFNTNSTELLGIATGFYDVWVGSALVDQVRIRQGGAYALIINSVPTSVRYKSKLLTVVEPNQINILWQLPQYFIITAGEIMFSVTGLEFSFTEAPDSMKSVLQACWQLTVTFGNLFVVLIAHLHIFRSQSSEFFLFAGFMVVDILLFSALAMRFRYRATSDDDADGEMDNADGNGSLDKRPVAMGVANSAFLDE